MDKRTAIPQFMGVRVKRREDPALITGAGKYVADIQLENMAYMGVVRSPYAHAKILEIDTGMAAELEGVIAILSGADITPQLADGLPMVISMGSAYSVKKNPVRYPLATQKVTHVGEAVAVVVAESPYIVADALDLIFVDYEPLEVVIDPEAALAADAPIIHEAWDDNLAFRWGKEGGAVEAAFAQAEAVVELRVVNQRVIPNAMEPRAVTAQYNPENVSFTIWTTTQIPHSVRDQVAKMLDMPPEQIRVIAPEVGGGFGAKGNIYGEEVLVPFLARHVGRPVKWAASRSEDYLATAHGRDQINTIRLAADKSGRVQAADLQIIMDCGSYYSRVSPAIPTLTAQMMTGVYHIPVARAEALGVFTNKQPTEPYRGAGRPEAAYLIERAMDLLADKLALDPAQVRRVNFITPDQFPYQTAMNATYDSGEYERALNKALELVDYGALRAEQQRRRAAGGKLMGIGVGCYVEVCGFGPWEMGTVMMDENGKVTVLTGTSPHGQGHETTWAQIAADTLQVPLEDVTVKHSDTAVVPRGIGTFGSRSTPVGGSAVMQNAEHVRERAVEIAAHLLEAASADITLNEGHFHVRGFPQRTVSWQAVVQAAQGDSLPEALQGQLKSDDDFKPRGDTYPFGAHVCVVEVDPETGAIEIVRYVTVDDCGRVINPMLVEGQVHGGIAQGVGQALFEAAVFDQMGNLLTGSLMDYALPKAEHFPIYETNRTETPSPLNSMGVKGIGEAATIGSTPTVVNAVVDALSHLEIDHIDMPLTAHKIWQILQSGTPPTQ